jgi:hypothetical protein
MSRVGQRTGTRRIWLIIGHCTGFILQSPSPWHGRRTVRVLVQVGVDARGSGDAKVIQRPIHSRFTHASTDQCAAMFSLVGCGIYQRMRQCVRHGVVKKRVRRAGWYCQLDVPHTLQMDDPIDERAERQVIGCRIGRIRRKGVYHCRHPRNRAGS